MTADELRGLADFSYRPSEIGAAIASGSFPVDAMVVARVRCAR